MNIAKWIPMGKENAVSRAELARLTGLPDRKIRAYVKLTNRELTREGKAILSSSGARGYWMTDDLEEMEEYLRESARRARSQYLHDAPIRELVLRRRGVQTIQVRGYSRRVKPRAPAAGQLRLEV